MFTLQVLQGLKYFAVRKSVERVQWPLQMKYRNCFGRRTCEKSEQLIADSPTQIQLWRQK
jgi:hypothetical protein